MEPAIVAAVQATPVFFDRDATIEQVAELTKEAAGHGARLVAFSEGFVPTYPDWVWRTVPWSDRDRDWYARWFDQAVDIPGPACDALGAIAARARVLPRDPGERARRRNRLQHDLLLRTRRRAAREAPQARGRPAANGSVWGSGDGSTLAVIDTPFGRVGGLICWENYMPLARAAMYEQGIDILLAPDVGQLRRVAAVDATHRQGRRLLRARHHVVPARAPTFPPTFPGRDEIYRDDDDWMSQGNTIIVDPSGDVLAGPAHRARPASCTPRSTRERTRVHGASSTWSATTRGPTCSSSDVNRGARLRTLRRARAFSAKIASIGPGSTSFCSAR